MINKILIDESERFNVNNSMGTKIFLNGEQLTGVTNITTNFGIDAIPTVTITLLAEVDFKHWGR